MCHGYSSGAVFGTPQAFRGKETTFRGGIPLTNFTLLLAEFYYPYSRRRAWRRLAPSQDFAARNSDTSAARRSLLSGDNLGIDFLWACAEHVSQARFPTDTDLRTLNSHLSRRHSADVWQRYSYSLCTAGPQMETGGSRVFTLTGDAGVVLAIYPTEQTFATEIFTLAVHGSASTAVPQIEQEIPACSHTVTGDTGVMLATYPAQSFLDRWMLEPHTSFLPAHGVFYPIIYPAHGKYWDKCAPAAYRDTDGQGEHRVCPLPQCYREKSAVQFSAPGPFSKWPFEDCSYRWKDERRRELTYQPGRSRGEGTVEGTYHVLHVGRARRHAAAEVVVDADYLVDLVWGEARRRQAGRRDGVPCHSRPGPSSNIPADIVSQRAPVFRSDDGKDEEEDAKMARQFEKRIHDERLVYPESGPQQACLLPASVPQHLSVPRRESVCQRSARQWEV
ncbi:hypothetical protein Bbelb_405860 [Branchiostoma belcheri]|nr:hypothetical protein Bbelb_405860 [Branchiostoma belcheri]